MLQKNIASIISLSGVTVASLGVSQDTETFFYFNNSVL